VLDSGGGAGFYAGGGARLGEARGGAGHERGSSPPIYRGGGGRAWRAQHACRGRRRLGQGGHVLKPWGLRWAQMGFGRPAAGPTEMRVGSGPRARSNRGIKILFFLNIFSAKQIPEIYWKVFKGAENT
jgi:hypothetical protein